MVGSWRYQANCWPQIHLRSWNLELGTWGIQECQVLEIKERALLSYTFAEGLLNSKITWRLVPEDGGTRLFLEHSDFDLRAPQRKPAFDGMSNGWSAVISRIESSLTDL